MENNNIDYILEFLKPYIKSMVAAGDYQAYLYQSTLYILVDNAAIFSMNLSTMVDPNFCISLDSKGLCQNNIFVYQKMIEVKSIISHTNNTLVYEDPVLMEDPKFVKLANAKASDGAGWYFMNTSIATIFIPVFLGLPSIKKQDQVGIKVYYIGDNKFMIHYNVFKKKLGTSYDLYYQILNVNCPLR